MNSNKGLRKKRENSKSAFNDQTKFYKENIWVGLYEAQKEFRYKDLERKFLLEIIDFIPTVTSAEELLSL
ncbi:hypothetical protein HDU92_001638 [Lobulomyces angularis]|nr:hypothetical protein HDU92_001638 [Lobulomyces angularis]